MNHFLKICALLALLFAVGCRGKEPVEPIDPVIVGQTIVNGAENVSAEPQGILILFDRDVVLKAPERVTISPELPFEVTVDGPKLRIITLEKMTYKTAYTLTIGEGVVKDKETDGVNAARTINFYTEEGPYVPPTELSMQLVSRNALPEVQDLYTYLWNLYGHYSVSGARSYDDWTRGEYEWVKQWTGSTPAMAVFNYNILHRSPSSVLDYSNVAPIEKWWAEGGIVAADWYWMVPTAEGVRQYTMLGRQTTLTVENMLTEGTWENGQMKTDLKEMADMLLLLAEKNIPVVWRPLPDASSSTSTGVSDAYWWGNGGAESFKMLWTTMFDYFEQRGVNNLVWVWSSRMGDFNYYPGDEYVDMICCDIFGRTATSIEGYWNSVEEYFPHKMLALGELRSVPAVGDQMNIGAHWAYFAPTADMNNDFTESYAHPYATIAWWQQTLSDDRVITREEFMRQRMAMHNSLRIAPSE